MSERLTVREVDAQIRELKDRIKELQKLREKVINETTLYPEGQIFVSKGYEAAEKLRRTDPELFSRKSMEAFNVDGRKYGLNVQYHRCKWDGVKAKACLHASHRRTSGAINLTEDELKLAKIYAMAFTKEWVEFWKGDM